MQKNKRSNLLFTHILCLFLMFLMTSCISGSTLRTARVLEQGQIEFSGGVSGTNCIGVSQVAIGAYGITDKMEIEGRWEEQFFAIASRLQILKSEANYIDGLVFFEGGYNKSDDYFQWGPGVMFGKRWSYIEPYISYRYRRLTSTPILKAFSIDFSLPKNFHYAKLGSRIYFSKRLNNFETHSKDLKHRFFLDLEVGPTFFGSDYLFDWAVNFGFQY